MKIKNIQSRTSETIWIYSQTNRSQKKAQSISETTTKIGCQNLAPLKGFCYGISSLCLSIGLGCLQAMNFYFCFEIKIILVQICN